MKLREKEYTFVIIIHRRTERKKNKKEKKRGENEWVI